MYSGKKNKNGAAKIRGRRGQEQKKVGGEVKTYKIPLEEIERMYGKAGEAPEPFTTVIGFKGAERCIMECPNGKGKICCSECNKENCDARCNKERSECKMRRTK